MSSVMMDRWSIENAIEYLGGDIEKYKYKFGDGHVDNYSRNSISILKCWDNFLTALIL